MRMRRIFHGLVEIHPNTVFLNWVLLSRCIGRRSNGKAFWPTYSCTLFIPVWFYEIPFDLRHIDCGIPSFYLTPRRWGDYAGFRILWRCAGSAMTHFHKATQTNVGAVTTTCAVLLAFWWNIVAGLVIIIEMAVLVVCHYFRFCRTEGNYLGYAYLYRLIMKSTNI